MEALDRTRLLSDIATVMSDLHVNILAANSTTGKDRITRLRFTFELGDITHLSSLLAAVKRVERDAVVLPSLGGSLPLYVLRDVLGAPSVTVAVANADNNQHAEDENLRLGNLWDAIAIAQSILSMERAN